MKRSSVFTTIIIAIFVLATVATVVLALDHKKWSGADYLGLEAFKLTYPFLLLVVLGGAISLVYKEFSSERNAVRAIQERLRNEAQRRRERWMALSRDLIETYSNSKRIRRLLRARALKKRGGGSPEGVAAEMMLDVAVYDKLIQELNDVQLSFETQARLAEADTSLETVAPGTRKHLRSIEKYLNRIIQENEDNLPTFTADSVSLKSLPALKKYVGSYRDLHEFKAEFKEPLLAILTSLISPLETIPRSTLGRPS